MLDLLEYELVFSMSGAGLHGGEHARPVDGGLREFVREDRNSQCEYAAQGGCVERLIE